MIGTRISRGMAYWNTDALLSLRQSHQRKKAFYRSSRQKSNSAGTNYHKEYSNNVAGEIYGWSLHGWVNEESPELKMASRDTMGVC